MSKVRGVFIVLALIACAIPATADARSFGSRTLKQGSSGSDVRTLQSLLTEAGYRTTIDGMFGRGTVRSVRSWETGADRAVNGRVSRADARQLRSDAAESRVGETEEPVDEEIVTDEDEAEALANPAATGGAGYVKTTKATLNPDGTATAPSNAPQEVKDIIAAGNEIHDMPYKYGGGHGKWKDSGYDCSGSVSYALHGAKLLKQPLDSTGFESFGSAGPGNWVTIYANSGHAYMVVAGLRYDTSAAKAQSNGSRWSKEMRSPDGYVVRHPNGL